MSLLLLFCVIGLKCNAYEKEQYRALLNNFNNVFHVNADKYKRYEKMFNEKTDSEKKKRQELKNKKKTKVKRKDRKLTILHDLLSHSNANQPDRKNCLSSGFAHDGSHNRSHSQTRVIVKTGSDTVIQTDKGSQNSHYQFKDKTGVSQINNHKVNLRNTVNSYDLNNDIYTNKDLNAEVQFRKIKHSDNGPDGDYEEIVIDRDIDESTMSHDLDDGELQTNAGLRNEVADNFTGANFGKDSGLQILQESVKNTIKEEESGGGVNLHQHNYINVNHNYLPLNKTENNVVNVQAAVKTENKVVDNSQTNVEQNLHALTVPVSVESQPIVDERSKSDDSVFNLDKLNKASQDLQSLLQQFQDNSDELNQDLGGLSNEDSESTEYVEEEPYYHDEEPYYHDEEPYYTYQDSPYTFEGEQLYYPNIYRMVI